MIFITFLMVEREFIRKSFLFYKYEEKLSKENMKLIYFEQSKKKTQNFD